VVAVAFQSVFHSELYQGFKIMFFCIFKKLFLISAHQNDIKISKTYYFEVKKKIKKKLIFLKNTFKTQKYTGKFLKIKPFPFPVR
jgi:hypothetical protein